MAIRTAKQLNPDERRDVVQSWLCSGVVSDKSQWVLIMAKILDVQQDTVRLVLYEEGWS